MSGESRLMSRNPYYCIHGAPLDRRCEACATAPDPVDDAAVEARWTIYKRTGEWDDVIEGADVDGLAVVPASLLAEARASLERERADHRQTKGERDSWYASTVEAVARAEKAEDDTERLREALEKIERLKDRWNAPLRHPVGDMSDPAYAGAAAWAAVGSEAHKIAADALSVDAGKPEAKSAGEAQA